MCPLCLATTGLCVAGGVSAGAVTTFLATKLLRKRPEPTALTSSTQTEGDDHAAPTIISSSMARAVVTTRQETNNDQSQDRNR